MGKENDLDRLFKRGLDDPEIPFNEVDWKRMERKLDGKKSRKVIPLWLISLSGIAAVLAIVMLWVFNQPELIGQQNVRVQQGAKFGTQAAGRESQSDTAVAGLDGSALPERIEEKLPVGGGRLLTNQGSGLTKKGRKQASEGSLLAKAEKLLAKKADMGFLSRDAAAGQAKVGMQNDPGALPDYLKPGLYTEIKRDIESMNGQVAGNTETARLKDKSATIASDSEILAQKANALANSKDPLERLNTGGMTREMKKGMEKMLRPDANLILTAMAAPDITTAKSSMSSKISSNFGVLGTYVLSPKFSLTSGAVYSRKFYNSGGTAPAVNSYTSGADWEVKADCNVLDIPVNVNYTLLHKKRLSVRVNTGLSSYFMLKEKYEFITGQPGPDQEISTLEVNNQNKHLFGVANVSLSFDHQLTQSLSVGVQPFAKLPLTGIGNGDVNLKSAGVSFSLNIGLFPAKKPGKYAANRFSSRPSF